MQRGVLGNLMGKQADPITDYEVVVNFRPDDVTACHCKGRVKLILRCCPEALEDLHKALDHAPMSVHALPARAEVHMRMHDFEKAHFAVATALELNLDCLKAYMLRGCIRIEQAEYGIGDFQLQARVVRKPHRQQGSLLHGVGGSTQRPQEGFTQGCGPGVPLG